MTSPKQRRKRRALLKHLKENMTPETSAKVVEPEIDESAEKERAKQERLAKAAATRAANKAKKEEEKREKEAAEKAAKEKADKTAKLGVEVRKKKEKDSDDSVEATEK